MILYFNKFLILILFFISLKLKTIFTQNEYTFEDMADESLCKSNDDGIVFTQQAIESKILVFTIKSIFLVL